jgi:hypothetical protein
MSVYPSFLRALLRESTWRQVRDEAVDTGFADTNTRCAITQIAHLHDRIPGRDLVPQDLLTQVQLSYDGDQRTDLVAWLESVAAAQPADDSIVREVLARQLMDRAVESVITSRAAGQLDIATPEEFTRRARLLLDSAGTSGVMALDEFGFPSAGTDRDGVMPLGVSARLDAILEGGTGNGELLIIAGKPKLGKTSMLRAIGANLVTRGAKVLDLTLEVRASKVARLYERAAIHTPKRDWTDTTTKDARELLHAGGGLVLFKDLSHTRVTVGTVEALIASVERERGIKLDAVILDYMGLMAAPGRTGREDQVRFAYAQIARDLRTIANRTRVKMLTAWQINREGAKKDTADETDLSECWDILMHADALFVMNRSTAEKENHRMRLLIAAQREDADAARSLTLHCDWGTMTVADVRKEGGNVHHETGSGDSASDSEALQQRGVGLHTD